MIDGPASAISATEYPPATKSSAEAPSAMASFADLPSSFIVPTCSIRSVGLIVLFSSPPLFPASVAEVEVEASVTDEDVDTVEVLEVEAVLEAVVVELEVLVIFSQLARPACPPAR